MTVWLIEEYEPNSEFAHVIKRVCATLELAEALVAEYRLERDEEGSQTDEDLWWEICAQDVQGA